MAKTKSGVFILGTDTEVGKTYQAAALTRQLVAEGHRIGVYKPAVSGVVPGIPSDPEILLAATGLDCQLERVSPQRFKAACAPPIAAHMESKRVDEKLLLAGAEWWRERCDFLIVEGAGGALSPISDSMTVLDLAVAIDFPTILIAANRLGVVNHALLTLEAIAARGLQTLGLVLNEIPVRKKGAGAEDQSTATNGDLLRQFAPDVQIVTHITELNLIGLSR